MASLTSLVNALTTRLAEKEARAEQLEELGKEYRELLEKKDMLIADLEQSNSTLMRNLHVAEQEKTQVLTGLQKKFQLLESERLVASKKLTEANIVVKELECKLVAKTEECLSLKKSLEETTHKLETMPDFIVECKQARNQVNVTIEELRRDRERLEFRITQALEIGERYKKESEKLMEKCVKLEAELAAHKAESELMRDKNVILEAEILSLVHNKASHEELEAWKSRAREAEEKVKIYEEELGKTRTLLLELQTRLETRFTDTVEEFIDKISRFPLQDDQDNL